MVAAALSKLTVTGFPATTAGAAQNFAVEAEDVYGNPVTGYTGTVSLSSSDTRFTLENTSYTFAGGDDGIHTFSAALETAGTQSILAIDLGDGLIAADGGIAVIGATRAASLVVSGYTTATTAGAAHGVHGHGRGRLRQRGHGLTAGR